MLARSRLPFEVGLLCSLRISGAPSFTTRYRAGAPRDLSTAGAASTSFLNFDQLPRFPARGRDLKVLYEPKDFYSFLLSGIKRARRRIFLASLYIGKEETALMQAIHASLANNPSLEVNILVDYLRSTREHPKSPSSASLIAALQAAFPKQVKISLYHTPALSGVLEAILPKRYNEGLGLWHGKIYGFDDDVVISGANLSNDYFTNRQDRYIAIRGHSPMADYFHELTKTFEKLSYSLKGRSSASGPDNFALTWLTDKAAAGEPKKHPRSFVDTAKSALRDFMGRYAKKSQRSLASPQDPVSDPAGFDTSLQPFLQMGPFGIQQETEHVVPTVLKRGASDDNCRLDWTSGYFSLREPYKDGLLNSRGPVRIVCASPEANGFFQSPGFSKYLPPAYTYAERRFWNAMKAKDQTGNIELHEWKRHGWTYHAKGIWLTPMGELPSLTLIGSSNYGYRSAVRDLEVNLAVQTTSPELRSALGKEIDNIRSHAGDRVDDSLFNRPDRKVGIINRLAARAIADML